MKKLFTFAAAILASISLWADQTDLIEGVTLPDIPASALDMNDQEFKTPDEEGWIIIEPNADVRNASVTWFTAMAWNTSSVTISDVSGFTAPFVALNSVPVTTVQQTGRTKAIRFTGASDISFLVSSGGSRTIYVSLYEYADNAQTLVDTKSAANSPTELLFSQLDATKDYIAYMYESTNSNGWVAEIAIKKGGVVTPSYNVTYYANNGTDESVEAPEVKKVVACMFDAPEGMKFVGWNTAADGTGEDYVAGDKLESDLDLYAQWAAVCYEVIYDLLGGVGSAEVTAANAEVGEDYLKLSNTDGRITLSAPEGKVFKNGDIIEFEGTVGNSGKAFGIKIGSQTIKASAVIPADPELPTAGGSAAAIGVLSLSEDAASIAIGRADGTTTTLTKCVIKREVECGGDETAINNTEDAVKAVKVIRNGQLFIEKNGVIYNAQGAVVK